MSYSAGFKAPAAESFKFDGRALYLGNLKPLSRGPMDAAPPPDWPDWPLYGLQDDIRPAWAQRQAVGEAVAIATLIATDGPSPRPAGAQMLIPANGDCVGYVSGGCVEATVAAIGREVLASGVPRRLVFGAGSPFFDIQLVCGTRIEVAVERAPADCPAVIEALAAWRARRPIVWVSRLDRAGRATAPEAPGAGKAGASPDRSRFWKRLSPACRLILVGGDPVALACARLAEALGLEAALIRPKGPDAPPPGLAGRYLTAGPEAALGAIGLDAWTALVATTHELDLDARALIPALRSPAFYVGALGSRRRVEMRREGLAAAGLSPEQIGRLHAPVGLEIGAATANEIALSILAGVVQAWRARPAG
jgi:xanthine dehydrogenase accessory factor